MTELNASRPSKKDPTLQLNELRDRVERLETTLFRAVVTVACVAIAIGFFVPFLSSTDPEPDEDGSLSLLTAAFALGDAGDGPFSGEATLVAIVVGGFALLAAVTLAVVAALLRPTAGERNLAVARGLCVALLVGCCVAWLLVLVLAGHFEGEVSAFSPALAFLTAGAVAGTLLRHAAPHELQA